MKWSYETDGEYVIRISQWHRWFAWYPVSYHGTGWWLETIECRGGEWAFGEVLWQYRSLDRE